MSKYATILVLLAAVTAPAGAQVVSYEAISFFPEEAGWTRDQTAFPVDRFLEDGRLVQFAETVPPNGWEQDSYRRFFPELAGSPTFGGTVSSPIVDNGHCR